jgi:hypothetical protein
MPRREFSSMVYAEIVRRAMDENGQLWCEGCGGFIKGKRFHVDHTIADGLILDKKRKLTAKDGKLLGIECCHAPKTAVDVKTIAKAKRVEKAHLGIKPETQPIPSRGFAKGSKPAKASRHDWAPALPPRQLYEKVTT